MDERRGGFDRSWLELREPYDHAARDPSLAGALAGALGERPAPWRILDLACGTGSGFRYLAPRLGAPQRWTLVDRDPALLAAAEEHLPRGGDWRAETRRHDLLGPELAPAGPWDAVVTSALLDLASSAWLRALADWLARERLPLLAALSVDGRARWRPADPDDGWVHASFRAHQLTDRGFGPSPGPGAAAELAALLRERGFAVRTARADWAIHRDRGRGAELIEAMIGGIARAAAEVSDAPRRVEAWRRRRLEGPTEGLHIGHLDLLALPPGD